MTRLRDNRTDFRALVGSAADDLGLPPAFVEKDYWVTEMLRSVFAELPRSGAELPAIYPVFKGGTSLSKVYELIQRFSEDVDVLLSATDASRGARQRALKAIDERARTDLDLAAHVRSKSEGKKRDIAFAYDPLYALAGTEASVRLEMGVRGGPQPNERASIVSYIAEHARTAFGLGVDEFEEFAPVECVVLAPERTLVEKLMCLHTRASDASTDSEAGRDVRHYYDICALVRDPRVISKLGNSSALVSELAADVHRQSTTWDFASEERPAAGFAASPAFQLDSEWCRTVRSAYEIVLPQLAWGDVPTFDECVHATLEIADRL